jgi:hypothetical protein
VSKKFAVLICMILGAAGAAGAGEDKPRAQPVAPPVRLPDPPGIKTYTSGTPVTTSSIPAEVRRAVVADAARRFKVATNDVVLTRAERITWPDASLGCAEPGKVYGQMLVEGFRVVARTVEGELLYHTDTRGTVLSCPRPGHDTTR